MPIALVILAAGKGTRMNSELPKVLHKIGGAPLFRHALDHAREVDPDRVILVTGHGADLVEAAARALDDTIECVRQDPQLGTGHAVLQARAALDGFDGDVLVVFGDTPFVQGETLQRLLDARATKDIVVLGFQAAPGSAYGRLVTEGDALLRIVEAADASPAEQALTLCNSGVLIANARVLFDLLEKVAPSPKKGEYYLTDVVALAVGQGLRAGYALCDEAETLGINTPAELARAETLFQAQMRAQALDNGVILPHPETVIFAQDTRLGAGVEVQPYVVFGPGVTVENNAVIQSFSHLEDCHVGEGARIGPYARLRPGAEIADNAHIGNFVEIKNAQIGFGAKVNHLSYIGDAEIGEATNIGAGTITCNYDGVNKHRTVIGARVFIGSDTMLVAPVKVGDGAMTASGSVITKDVPAGDLAIGRARQENKQGYGARLMDMLRAAKARASKG